MATDTTAAPVGKAAFWGGWVLSLVPGALLTFSGVMKVMQAQPVVEGFPQLGWPAHLAVAIGVVELVSTVLYLIPRTAVLGAILLTGYLGGAIATHVRLEEQFVGPLVFGVLAWLGLYLRDPRIRALVPCRS